MPRSLSTCSRFQAMAGSPLVIGDGEILDVCLVLDMLNNSMNRAQTILFYQTTFLFIHYFIYFFHNFLISRIMRHYARGAKIAHVVFSFVYVDCRWQNPGRCWQGPANLCLPRVLPLEIDIA